MSREKELQALWTLGIERKGSSQFRGGGGSSQAFVAFVQV